SILGGLLGGKIGQNTANILNTVGGIGLNALFLKYGRDLETQADVRGSQILAASGYSPTDMINFFHTLEQVDKSKKTNWLSDHPAPPDRIARIQKESQMLKVSQTPTTNVAELNDVKSRLRSFGSAPTMGQIAQGTTANNGGTSRPTRSGSAAVNVPAPASAMRTYVPPSGVYQIAYPSNWRVYQQGNLAATIAPEGGVGEINGKTEVVYGAMINHYSPFNSGSRNYLRGTTSGGNVTLQNATNDLLGQITQSSPHLKLINNSGQQFNLDGRTALAASLRGTNPNTGIQERVTVVTRQLGDEHLVYLLFVTPEKDASRYGPVLQSMVNSMRVDESQGH
ncbi:MAG TPA: M48 family metalloprotease, partial [Thermoanaerobaculia bacterium]|nr:M48 family metalloprotease [Thermoanaerobaculia bacterium]